MMYTFRVEDFDGHRIADYEICADSVDEAWKIVEHYAVEDDFYKPIISLM